MSCKICGRNSCIESFHSLEEQDGYVDTTEQLESKIEQLESKIDRLESKIEQLEEIIIVHVDRRLGRITKGRKVSQ